jgi:hypothetical protein
MSALLSQKLRRYNTEALRVWANMMTGVVMSIGDVRSLRRFGFCLRFLTGQDRNARHVTLLVPYSYGIEGLDDISSEVLKAIDMTYRSFKLCLY